MINNDLNNKLLKMAASLEDVTKQLQRDIEERFKDIKDETVRKFLIEAKAKAERGEITPQEFLAKFKALMNK